MARLAEIRTLPGSFPDNQDDESSENDLTRLTLSQAIHARRSEFIRSKQLRLKIGSWNTAAKSGAHRDVGGWLVDGKGVAEALAGLSVVSTDGLQEGVNPNSVRTPEARESVEDQESRASKKKSTIPRGDRGTFPGADDIDLYAIGLQEVVDVSSPAETLRPYSDPSTAQKWKKAVAEALPPGYQIVAEQQLIGLLLLVYASEEITSSISAVSTCSVGTGLMGYVGNKGAVAARVVLGDATRLVFINSHLAAGAEKANLERRNWDAAQIASRIRFDPFDNGSGYSTDPYEGLGSEDLAWWFGDLNYRLDNIPGDDVRRLLMLHTRNEYDLSQRSNLKIEKEIAASSSPITMDDGEARSRVSSESASTVSSRTAFDTISSRVSTDSGSTKVDTEERLDPHSDPASLQTTLSSLLPHDQLQQQQASRKAFHDGWQEGPIGFLPTYKYDVGSVGVFDSSEKKRGPSWCDRILYRTRRDKLEFDSKIEEEAKARRRDEEMKARGIDKAAEDDNVLFDYDPENDGADDGAPDQESKTTANQPPESAKTEQNDGPKLDIYSSHQRVLSSDHKPLSAIFTLSYDAVVPGLKAKVHQEVARELDRAENEARPGITIAVDHHHGRSLLEDATVSGHNADRFDPSISESVDFGDVHYDEPIARSVTIANTGRVPAVFKFVDRSLQDNHADITPHWLNLRFDHQAENMASGKEADVQHETTLEPGDTINLVLTLQIHTIEDVRKFNEGQAKIEDVLVLRVDRGRDHFLTVRGSWMQSCFGRTINELIRIPEGGVHTLQDHGMDEAPLQSQSIKWSAPREMFRLTEAVEELVERAIAERSMTSPVDEDAPPWEKNHGWPFSKSSWTMENVVSRHSLKLQVHQAIDGNQPIQQSLSPDIPILSRVEVVSETLLDFLRSLQDGVVTESLWAELEKIITANEKAKKQMSVQEEQNWILEVLSTAPNHNICFVFLTSMLARVASEIAPLNQLKPARSGNSSESTPTSPKIKRRSTGAGRGSVIERREQIDESLARIFGDAMIRRPLAPREKERKTQEERIKKIVEVFLRGKWEEGR
ncbi:MAG: hypothetical protein M4579_000251 [Chaenotheca gracillima]|nr:MAG: hypothetical protein M4579_000251 [Chaenotheca gracillima]